MARAVEGFTGLEHALEPVATIQGVGFFNDSKATNIESAARAIEAFDRGWSAIVGGRYKGGDFARLRRRCGRAAASVVAIGEAAPLVTAALAPSVPVRDAASMDDAVRLALRDGAAGRHRAAGAGVRELRHVRDYAERGRRVQGHRGPAARSR